MDPVAVGTVPKTRRQRKRELKDSIALAAAPTDAATRPARLEVRKVDIWSVLKVSLCFYLSALAVLLVAAVVLWLLADAAGLIHDFESFMGDLLSSKNYSLVPAQILEGGVLMGLVLVALLVIVTVVAAALYNVFASWVGGVEMVVRDEGRR